MQIFTYDNNEDVKDMVDKYGFHDILKDVRVRCWYYETRNSWGHKGEVETPTHYLAKGHITYYNRTWERYTYESLLKYLLRCAMTELTGINYNKVCLLDDEGLKDLKELKRKDFRNKYGWCDSKDYTAIKKHYERIGVL